MYTIRDHSALLQDSPQNIDFHIRSGDYFSFLATLMGFVEEALGTCANTEDVIEHQQLAKELRRDLRYIQANYKIVPRTLDDIQVIRPGGNLLRK